MPIATKSATKQYTQLQQQRIQTANTMTASDDNNSTHASSSHSTTTTTATANNPHAHATAAAAATAAFNINNSTATNLSGGISSLPPLQPPPPPPPALSSGNLNILNGSIGIASAHAHPSSHTYGHAPSAVMTSATAAAFANVNAAMSSSGANNYNMPTYANITVIPSNAAVASNVQAANAVNANAPIALFMGSGLVGGAAIATATATSAGRGGGGAIGVGNTNDNNNNMDNTSEESNAVTIYR